jgi:hypothetical protein
MRSSKVRFFLVVVIVVFLGYGGGVCNVAVVDTPCLKSNVFWFLFDVFLCICPL